MIPTEVSVGALVARRASAILYRGHMLRENRPVILKVALRTDRDAEVARIEREHAIVSRLNADGVVKTFGITTLDLIGEPRPTLLLEDFGGKSLDLLIEGPATVERFLTIAIGLARAIATVHELGVVHRDIKPSNVIVLDDQVKLTDFGIATAPFLDSAGDEGAIVGTLAYLAPEQTGRLNRPVDHRADLYSMGITLYELLTGQLPFQARDALEWVHFHIARTPRSPSELAPHAPDMISAIILALIAKSPEDRYQSAAGLHADLQRCLAEWSSSGAIAPFQLRDADLCDAFEVPRHLYGRDVELQRLTDSFEAVALSGQPAVVFVSGLSGTGKSSLVRELHGPVAAAGALFASGKFESLRRGVPYSALRSAIAAIVDQLLATSGQRLVARKEALAAALGANARVLVDVFPELDALLGQREPARELGPAETQNRFQLVFRSFLGVVARAESPLVLFLDDMQWADPASFALIESMCDASLPAALLLVLTFRDNEVGAEHPFTLTAARIRAAVTRADDVTLGPFDEATVGAIVADTLHTTPASAAALARLVHDKTGGNPFFVDEFLVTLHSEGLLRFDRSARTWTWNLADIEAKEITDNVVQLMIDRIEKLPAATRESLRLAACIGSSFELEMLAIVRRLSAAEVAAELRPAVERGLLVLRRESEKLLYGFRHDRVQQAAYALLPDEQRAEVRVRIARLLRAELTPEQLDERLFDVVNHYAVALDLITDAHEREDVRRLCERAGRRARAATAYTNARRYLLAAERLLPPGSEDSFALGLLIAECEYLLGALDPARARFGQLLDVARTDLERAKVLYLQMRLDQLAGDYRAATDVALRSFQLFGLTPPTTADEATRTCAELQREADALLAGRSINDLLDAPLLTDDRLRAIADLLESSGPPIYMVRAELFPWITLQLLVLSLRHGNCEASCYAYGIYALMRAAAMDDVDGGFAFAELAIKLNEKLGDARLRGCMLHLLGDHVNFWKHPFASDLPILDRGFQACLEGGDLIYSNYIAFQMPWHAYEAGLTLDAVWTLTERFTAFARRTNPAVYCTIRFEQQFIRDLRGLTPERGTFAESTFDESSAIATIDAARFGCGVVYRHILTMIARYNIGDLTGARDAMLAAEPELGSAFSMPIYATFMFYRALICAAIGGDAMLARAVEDHAQLTRWAANCPENFADKVAIAAAEIARASGRATDAMGLYERGIDAARASGHLPYEALAVELAARFYLAAGAPSVAAPLIDEAVAIYRRWGALAKAARVAELAAPMQEKRRARTTNSGTTTSGTLRAHLDLLPVVKAAQTLSEQVVLSSLLDKLMAIVIEYAGAERGVLLLREGESMRVAATATVDGAVAIANNTDAHAALSIVHYVQRTGEPVILDDALLPNPFSADPHFAGRRARSVMCMPIARHSKLAGVFYLENNLVTRAFSAERLAVLDILAAQAAISIDNARLFSASQEAIAIRDEFLSVASHELKTPLTPLKLKLQSFSARIRQGRLAELTNAQLVALATTIDSQLSRLANLVEGLVDVSRIHTGRLTLERRDVDLAHIAAEVAQQYAETHPVEMDALSPVVGEWDPLRLEQVVANLVTNAVKHAPGAQLTVRVRGDARTACLIVEDSGPGIAPADASRIFDKFVSTNQAVAGGLGLGLYIARQIVEAHGGSLRLDSKSSVGTGARFVVELPRRAAP